MKVHGIPLTFQEVDHPDQERRQGWIDYLTKSDAVRKAAPKIESMHIGTLAHFYFRDAEIPFKCKAHDRVSTLERCEGCPDWFRPDNVCQVDGMGAYLETQPPIKDIALDTMHILRVTLRGKKN